MNIKDRFPLKYILLWTVICILAAVPSFRTAVTMQYSMWGMILGVMVFIAAYTFFSTSYLYARLKKATILRRAFYTGFFLRLALSLSVIVALLCRAVSLDSVAPFFELPAVIDIVSGFMAVQVVDAITGFHTTVQLNTIGTTNINSGFFGTFLTTLIQGFFLNIMIFVTMVLAIIAQWAWNAVMPRRNKSG